MPGMPPLGIVRPGIADGTASMSTPIPSSSPAVPHVATRRQGRIFSVAMSPATTDAVTVLLSAHGVRKSFGGVEVLHGVDLDAASGSIRAREERW